MDVQQPEIDPDFEPQQRARCNTWPCRPREVAVDAQSSPVSDESTSETHAKNDALGLNNKKTSSRRNAWGNLSYADLITKAIQSSPDHRLTLSQIYDWMVQNVPYFKDKGDNTSSAGWKNSIRHNLSLHSRFMRIQNEGTGKSSWWVINPDAKPGKTPRRRAGSMETKSYEKRRGRVKKKVEALRAALENSNSPSSTTDDYLDSPLSFQLSPDFRPRASSNASSCGRLSPIQAGIEPDLHDNQVPPMSPIPWGQELDTSGSYDQMGQYDKLVDTLVDSMKLGDATIPMGGDTSGLGMGIDPNDVEMLSDSHGLTQQLMNSSHSSHGNINESLTQQLLNSRSGNIGNAPQYNDQSANYDDAQYGTLPAPPAYPGDSIRHSPQQQQQQQQGLEQLLLNGSYGDLNQMQQNNLRIYNNQQQQPAPLFSQEALLVQQTRGSPSSSQLSINTQQQQLSSPSRSPQTQISPNYGNMGNYSAQQQQSPQNNVKQLSPQQQMLNRQQQQQQQGQTGGQPSLLQRCLEAPPESLLRAALTQKAPQYQMTSSSPSSNQSHYNNMGYTTSQHQGQQLTNLRPVPPQPMNSNGINNNILSSPQQQQQQQQQNNRTLIPNLQQHMSSQNQMTTQLVSTSQLINTDTLASNNSGNSLNEIEADFFDLGCDMEKVLQQELSLEGNLDFNFDPSTSAPGSVDVQNLVR